MPSNDIPTKTWLITGAGRGMGADFTRAALAAGHHVVATARNPATVRSAVGEREGLLVARLDVTDEQSAAQAVAAAVERFGRIDVLWSEARSPRPTRRRSSAWRAGWRAWPARWSRTGSAR